MPHVSPGYFMCPWLIFGYSSVIWMWVWSSRPQASSEPYRDLGAEPPLVSNIHRACKDYECCADIAIRVLLRIWGRWRKWYVYLDLSDALDGCWASLLRQWKSGIQSERIKYWRRNIEQSRVVCACHILCSYDLLANNVLSNDIDWDMENKRLIAVGDSSGKCAFSTSVPMFMVCFLNTGAQIWACIHGRREFVRRNKRAYQGEFFIVPCFYRWA